MADDLKISEMNELLAGGFHDDLLFEVVDLTEIDSELQNKKVKWITIQAVIDPSQISQGNSFVKVVDAGTGQVEIEVDALNLMLAKFTDIRFGYPFEDATDYISLFHARYG